uniref:Uncharacterized protein n=1 Tax=Solanum tuberosum TaxID=4113 RepID=M1DK30_SOLTU
MKTFGISSLQNPLKLRENISKTDHSASLVGVADQLDDLPFCVVHRRLAPSCSIVMLWVIGRYGTASRNFSVMHRLLHFSADLILSFRAQHTETKGNSLNRHRPCELHGIRCIAPHKKEVFHLPKVCNFGQSNTASRNHSAILRLLRSLANLIFSSKAWHTGTLGGKIAIRQLAK